MKNDNHNCDGAGPHTRNPETRYYPLGGGANAILCAACAQRENAYRAQRRASISQPVDPAAFPHQAWAGLKINE